MVFNLFKQTKRWLAAHTRDATLIFLLGLVGLATSLWAREIILDDAMITYRVAENLAYGRGESLVTMARYVGEVLGVEPAIRVEASKVGEVTHYVANIGKARALLGYDPKTPLREGIARAVVWSREWRRQTRPSV